MKNNFDVYGGGYLGESNEPEAMEGEELLLPTGFELKDLQTMEKVVTAGRPEDIEVSDDEEIANYADYEDEEEVLLPTEFSFTRPAPGKVDFDDDIMLPPGMCADCD